MATQQTVPHCVQQSKLAVVPFPAPQAVSQLEILALLSLRGRLHQLQGQVEAAEQSIRMRIEKGCAVEEGDHIAGLKENFRRNVAWKDIATRLADKVYFGKGLSYVERILRRTKPTRTVSLVIE